MNYCSVPVISEAGPDSYVDAITPEHLMLLQESKNYTDAIWESHASEIPISNSVSPSNGLLSGELYLHPHWSQYRDVINEAPAWFLYLLGVYMTVVSITGFVGNVTVIVVFLRTATLRTPSNYFIINLAFSDASFSLIFPLMSIACFNGKWIWGQTGCELYGFIAGVCGMNSIGTLTLIAVDRYLAVSRPLEMLYKATPRRSLIAIAFIWIYAAMLTCPPLFGWSRYIGEGIQVSCSFDYLTRTAANIAFNYYLVGFGFLLPVVVISGCYLGIIRVASQQTEAIMRAIEPLSFTRGSDTSQPKNDRARRDQEVKRAKNVAIMISLFVLSWTPYALIAQFGIIGLDSLVTPFSTEIPIMLAKASAIWNPIVYALTNPRYKAALQQICTPCAVTRRRGEAVDTRRPSQLTSVNNIGTRWSLTEASPNMEMVFLTT